VRTIALTLFLTSCIRAQPLPDGESLVKGLGAALTQFHSIQSVDQMTTETSTPQGPVKAVAEVSIARLNPGKSRIETKVQGSPMRQLQVSDGEVTTIYNTLLKEYVKIPAALGPEATLRSMGITMPDVSNFHMTSKTLRGETIEIDGAPHDCWVVESQLGELTLPPQQNSPMPAKMTGVRFTQWIDRKLNLTLRTDFDLGVQIASQPPTSVHATMVKTELEIDRPLPDSLFTFTPPAGAKEVKEFALFRGPLPKPGLAGTDAPPFEVKDLQGKAYSLSGLKGKPVLLDFWATWCGPCRNSMPVVEKLYREYKDHDLVVLSVDAGEDRNVVEEFLKKNPLDTPAPLSGDSGILQAYKVQAYPTFVLIGRDGKVAAEQIGFAGEAALRSMLAQAGLQASEGK
jgi:thiol-disulfide isomerase/thioredoxin